MTKSTYTGPDKKIKKKKNTGSTTQQTSPEKKNFNDSWIDDLWDELKEKNPTGEKYLQYAV